MTKACLQFDSVNRAAQEDWVGLVEETEEGYARKIDGVARRILAGNARIIMLAGPSGSGKTTTASFLAARLTELGRPTRVVSLDDFYLHPKDMPLDDQGKPDFETVHALDLPHLRACLQELFSLGRCELPVFDFINHRIDGQTRLLELGDDHGVIFEGLHALNPLICDCLPAQALYRLYVHLGRDIFCGNRVLLSARDLRLVRRMIRDVRFRSSPPSNTLAMWQGVVRGEERYLHPFIHTAEEQLDSLHEYEPCIFRNLFLELLEQVHPEDPHSAMVRRVGDALISFPPMAADQVPEGSLLREFIGK